MVCHLSSLLHHPMHSLMHRLHSRWLLSLIHRLLSRWVPNKTRQHYSRLRIIHGARRWLCNSMHWRHRRWPYSSVLQSCSNPSLLRKFWFHSLLIRVELIGFSRTRRLEYCDMSTCHTWTLLVSSQLVHRLRSQWPLLRWQWHNSHPIGWLNKHIRCHQRDGRWPLCHCNLHWQWTQQIWLLHSRCQQLISRLIGPLR